YFSNTPRVLPPGLSRACCSMGGLCVSCMVLLLVEESAHRNAEGSSDGHERRGARVSVRMLDARDRLPMQARPPRHLGEAQAEGLPELLDGFHRRANN